MKEVDKLLTFSLFFYLFIKITLNILINKKNYSLCNIIKNNKTEVILILIIFYSYFILKIEKKKRLQVILLY